MGLKKREPFVRLLKRGPHLSYQTLTTIYFAEALPRPRSMSETLGLISRTTFKNVRTYDSNVLS